MAASGNTAIALYYSATPTQEPAPGNLRYGELALNIYDGKLYYKDNTNAVQLIASKGSTVIGGSNTQVQYNNSGVLGGSPNLTFDGSNLTVGGNVTIGGAMSTDGDVTVGGDLPVTGDITGALVTVTGSTAAVNGVFLPATNSVGISTNSIERVRVDASGNLVLKTGSIQEVKAALSTSNINLSTGNYFSKTISTTTTFTVSNVPATNTAICFVLDLTNGGSATVNWWSGMTWAGGLAPTLTASGRDTLAFFTYDNGTTWNGFVLGQAMA